MAKCLNCGSELLYDIKLQKLKCQSCDSAFEPSKIDKEEKAEEADMMGVTVFTCPNCGGELYSSDHDLTGACSYCGSLVTFSSRMVRDKRPKMILPFSLTKEECKELYIKEAKADFFAPKALKDKNLIDSFRGIYMPYWISKLKQQGHMQLYYVHEDQSHDDFKIIDTNRYAFDLSAGYEGLYHDASSCFSDDISERIEPFNLSDEKNSYLKPFYPSYLSGFYAEPADVEADAYRELYTDLAKGWTDKYLDEHKSFDGQTMVELEDRPFYDSLEPMDSHKAAEVYRYIREENQAQSLKEKHAAAKAQHEREKEIEEFAKKKKAFTENADKAEKKAPKYSYDTRMTESYLAMLPVWFLSYRNKDRVAYMTINGQTGKVSSEFPIDLKQFFKAALVFTLVFFLAAAWLMLLPDTVAVCAIWFCAAVLYMNHSELLMVKEHSFETNIHIKREDTAKDGAVAAVIILCVLLFGAILISGFSLFDSDMEVMRSHVAKLIYAIVGLALVFFKGTSCIKNWISLPKKEKRFPGFIAAGLSALIAFLVLLANPNQDIIYYAVCCLTLLAQSLSVMIMAKQFSDISARPLPQFSHKGGDDRA